MFEIRKIKKDKWLIILLVGLLLVVIAMPVSDIKSDQTITGIVREESSLNSP